MIAAYKIILIYLCQLWWCPSRATDITPPPQAEESAYNSQYYLIALDIPGDIASLNIRVSQRGFDCANQTT